MREPGQHRLLEQPQLRARSGQPGQVQGPQPEPAGQDQCLLHGGGWREVRGEGRGGGPGARPGGETEERRPGRDVQAGELGVELQRGREQLGPGPLQRGRGDDRESV